MNDELAELSPLTRILFIGLWCAADRAGRMEDRPLRLKAQIVPFDNCDVDEMLTDLERSGHIVRYEAENARYIQIANFEKHQSPHIKERESTIPAPYEYGASTVQAPDEPDINPPDSGFSDSGSLIPDTGYLNADSGTPEARVRATAEILLDCSWVGDEIADVERQVSRSFELVPDFDTRDGPLEAERYGRHWARKKSPPADWYKAWLNWIKKAVQISERDAEQYRHNGAGQERPASFSDVIRERRRQLEHAADS